MLIFAAAFFTLIISSVAGKTVTQQAILENRILTRKPFLKFQNTPKDTVLLAGEPLQLDCVITGAPTASIQWKINDKIIQESSSAKRADVQQNEQKLVSETSMIHSILSIDCPRSGTYKCASSNGFNSIETSATVSIIGEEGTICIPSLVPKITSFDMFRLELNGNAVTLRCESNDNNAQWTWKRDGRKLVNGEKFSVMGNDLLIRNIEWDLEGEYQCVASNPQGSASQNCFLMPASQQNIII